MHDVSACHLAIFWLSNWKWSKLLSLWLNTTQDSTKIRIHTNIHPHRDREGGRDTEKRGNPTKVSYKTLKSRLTFIPYGILEENKNTWNTQNMKNRYLILLADVEIDHFIHRSDEQRMTLDSVSQAVTACHKYRKSVREAGLCGWVRGSMGEPQIWGALMSLFGAQLCVCLWRLKSIRNLLGVRAPLRLRWLCALERPEWPTSTSFSPQSAGCEAIRLHRTDAWRALKHQNMLSNHPQRV